VPSPGWAVALFGEIARPRLPGSPGLSIAERAVTDRLEATGFTVTKHAFATSPRRLYAASLAAAGMGWMSIGLAPLFVVTIPGWTVLTIGFAGLALVALIATGIANGQLPFDATGCSATNIEATRGRDPRVWLVAHLDSKGQRISLRGRIIFSALLVLGLIGLIGVLAARWFGPLPWWVFGPAVITTVVGASGLSLPPLHGESPGAVDNASGVIAALCAAEALGSRDDVGVLLTSAEEYAMEGARAWVRAGRAHGLFVNFDGIDARGRCNIMVHGGRGPDRDELSSALRSAFRSAGQDVRRAPLPLGVFVDGSVLGAGGMSGVTVSRGDWVTLSVIHTPRDAPERTDVSGAVQVGRAAGDALAVILS
jgi:Peptidase family M28